MELKVETLLAYFATRMRAAEAINIWRSTHFPNGIPVPAPWGWDDDWHGVMCSRVPQEMQILSADQRVGKSMCEKQYSNRETEGHDDS